MTRSKPTILHTIDTTGPGGAETVFLNLAEFMELEGYDKLALIKGQGWVQQQLEKRGIPHIVLRPYGFLSIPYYLQLLKLLRKHDVQFVQAHLLGSALTFAILSFFMNAPVIATLHGQVDVNPNERFVGVKRWLLKRGLTRVVAVSRQLADYLEERGLFGAKQLRVIHNGIDVQKYSLQGSQRIRDELGLDQQAVFVGSVGNIRPAKDYQNLIKAAKTVVNRKPETHFLIAGHSKQPLQGELDALVQKLGLDGNVHFLGFVENTPEFLSQLDTFALSSSAEGFSIATLEAMAARIPIVVTKCGGPEEIIESGKDGIMVSVSDPDALADAILSALDSQDNLTQSAYEKVKNKFSQESLITNYSLLARESIGIK